MKGDEHMKKTVEKKGYEGWVDRMATHYKYKKG